MLDSDSYLLHLASYSFDYYAVFAVGGEIPPESEI